MNGGDKEPLYVIVVMPEGKRSLEDQDVGGNL
jgi:hypothetical protein